MDTNKLKEYYITHFDADGEQVGEVETHESALTLKGLYRMAAHDEEKQRALYAKDWLDELNKKHEGGWENDGCEEGEAYKELPNGECLYARTCMKTEHDCSDWTRQIEIEAAIYPRQYHNATVLHASESSVWLQTAAGTKVEICSSNSNPRCSILTNGTFQRFTDYAYCEKHGDTITRRKGTIDEYLTLLESMGL